MFQQVDMQPEALGPAYAWRSLHLTGSIGMVRQNGQGLCRPVILFIAYRLNVLRAPLRRFVTLFFLTK